MDSWTERRSQGQPGLPLASLKVNKFQFYTKLSKRHDWQVMRYHHYAYRTEKTYSDWILRYIKFHGGKTYPKNMGKKEIEVFLSHLATQGKVSASTQR